MFASKVFLLTSWYGQYECSFLSVRNVEELSATWPRV